VERSQFGTVIVHQESLDYSATTTNDPFASSEASPPQFRALCLYGKPVAAAKAKTPKFKLWQGGALLPRLTQMQAIFTVTKLESIPFPICETIDHPAARF